MFSGKGIGPVLIKSDLNRLAAGTATQMVVMLAGATAIEHLPVWLLYLVQVAFSGESGQSAIDGRQSYFDAFGRKQSVHLLC